MTTYVHKSISHDSGHKHVAGTSVYIDDIPVPHGCLHGAFGLSSIAHGEILSINLDAVRASEGVVDVFVAGDVPGNLDISPTHVNDEPLLAKDKVMFLGQQIFLVVAQTRDQARKAATRAKIEYRELPHHISIDQALAAGGDLATSGACFMRGDLDAGLKASTHIIEREFNIGGQEQFYLESQIAMAVPGEDGEVLVHSSTQNPTEVQAMVAHCLNVPAHKVVVEVRRMGGGFGGKETQPTIFAAMAAIAATKLGVAVKIRPDRDDDMTMTGKRHDFKLSYKVGFDDAGLIECFDADLYARAGYASDLSASVTDRALFHADNAYYYPSVALRSHPLRTHTVSNTAFRGFGGPQGIILAERVIEEIARDLGADAFDIRLKNLYGVRGNLTPYHQEVIDNIAPRMMQELAESCDYHKRLEAVRSHNATNTATKKGISLMPVKFGISFTATFLNQAGALIHVYSDGSVQVNHGGTEMGQGLNIKMAQIAAEEFQIPIDLITVTATNTSKVPNTSATAASSGSDLNGKAVEDAAQKIKWRIIAFLSERESAEVVLTTNGFEVANKVIAWKDAVHAAYFERVQLSSTGFYKTPDISWDREAGRGNPFYYFSYGAACSEVTVDRYTGDYTVNRVDILHDVGKSLNPAIDLGQVEGAFIQGMGWLTKEELVWDEQGRLRTHAPSTYKIPLASDLPKQFEAKLVDWSVNEKPTIRRSKAVGEPPFNLAISVFCALDMAVASVGDPKTPTGLDAPATPERVLMAMDARDGGL